MLTDEQQGIIIVANRKPYFELSSGQAVSASRFGLSAAISLVLRTRAEADAVATALRRRYSLSSAE